MLKQKAYALIVMNPLILLTIGLIAIVTGILSIIAGFGGGVFLVPILNLFFGYPLKAIIGTVLLVLVFPAATGSIGAWRRGEIDFRLAFLFEIPTMFGAIIGAFLTSSMPEILLKLIFGFLAFFFSTLMLVKTLKQKDEFVKSRSKILRRLTSIIPVIHLENEQATYNISIPVISIGGMTIGILAGMLGVGGGWLKTPLLVLVFGVPPLIASGTAIFMIFLTALSGGLAHLFHGNIDPVLFVTLSFTLFIGALLGNKVKAKMNNNQVAQFVGISLMLIALLMIFSALLS